MYYVERLRSWRVMRVFLIILALLFVLGLVGRLSGHGQMNIGEYAVPSGARAVHSMAPDGSKLTTYHGKHGQIVVVRTAPNGDQTLKITEPATAGATASRAHVGTITITETPHGKRITTIIHNSNRIPLDALFVVAAFLVSIFTSILGLSLSAENDGHLELAWTKPIGRVGYAGVSMAVDTAAALALLAVTVVLEVALLPVYGALRYLAADAGTLLTILWCILYVLAVYGVVMATTASLRRASGVALAILWPALLILPGLTDIRWLNIGTFARAVDTINPVAYLYTMTAHASHTLLPAGMSYEIPALAIITAVGLLASIAQWRRLEA